tara:strand:- start:67 stop:465 length:399 start_codon:yes stop_codon:yes gene_type:complete
VDAQRPAIPRDLIGLLVASDADMRRALAHLLEGWGVNVLDVPDPPEALALLEDIGMAPDFLLIDARPGQEPEALALVAALRAQFGGIPARLLSASRAEALRLSAGSAGAPVLYKPLDTRLLELFIIAAAHST